MNDLNVRFYLTAVDSQFEFRANTFTDAISITAATIVTRESTCTTTTSTFSWPNDMRKCHYYQGLTVVEQARSSSFGITPVRCGADDNQDCTYRGSDNHGSPDYDRRESNGNRTVKVCKTASCSGSIVVASASFTLNALISTTTAELPHHKLWPDGHATVTVSSVSAAPTGSVSVTVNNGGSAVCGTHRCNLHNSTHATPILRGFLHSNWHLHAKGVTQQQGGGTLTVNKAPLTITANNDSKTCRPVGTYGPDRPVHQQRPAERRYGDQRHADQHGRLHRHRRWIALSHRAQRSCGQRAWELHHQLPTER